MFWHYFANKGPSSQGYDKFFDIKLYELFMYFGY